MFLLGNRKRIEKKVRRGETLGKLNIQINWVGLNKTSIIVIKNGQTIMLRFHSGVNTYINTS